MIRPTRLGLLRFWLSGHRELVGLIPAALLVLALFFLKSFTLGPDVPSVGRIAHIGYAPTKGGDRPFAVTRVHDQLVRVGLPRTTTCKVGDEIHFRRRRRLWGVVNLADLQPCPPSRR